MVFPGWPGAGQTQHGVATQRVASDSNALGVNRNFLKRLFPQDRVQHSFHICGPVFVSGIAPLAILAERFFRTMPRELAGVPSFTVRAIFSAACIFVIGR